MSSTLTRPGQALPATRRHVHWPTWLVSAKHRTVVSSDGDSDWFPVGVHHARRASENLTACGIVAIGWPVFWLMPFVQDASTSCPACIEAVTTAGDVSHRERQGCCSPRQTNATQ